MSLALAIGALACALAAATASSRLPQDGIQLLQASLGAARGADAAATGEGARQNESATSEPFKCRVLLFFSVGTQPMTKQLVRRNVEHFRAAKGLSGDVYLAHYDHKRDEWLHDLGTWYRRHVDFSAEVSGLKFWLAKDLLLPSRQETTGELLPKVDIHSYDYLWILDEDANFFHANLTRMFYLASKTRASIMTPAFTTAKNPNTTVHLPKRRRSGGSADSSVDSDEDFDLGCQPTEPPCLHQAPNRTCRFRYTNFLETTFPFMRPQAFQDVIGECEECLPNRTSTWGLDKVWCLYAAESQHLQVEKTCAILDATPIIHENTKAHPKYKSEGPTCGKECNNRTQIAVQEALPQYMSWPPVTHECRA